MTPPAASGKAPRRSGRRRPADPPWAEIVAIAQSPDPERSRLATAARAVCARIADEHPGRTVELRVPPFAAVQLGLDEGSTHRRGTPPNVVETDAHTLLRLAVGELSWSAALAGHLIGASGIHSDLSVIFPLAADQRQ